MSASALEMFVPSRDIGQAGAFRHPCASDPAALPGWLITTARQECGRVLRAAFGKTDRVAPAA